MNDPFLKLREECLELNLRLPKLGLVLFTFGNVSLLDPDRRVFAIKPSGVPYETMKPSDIVVCDLDGRKVDGRLNPSSDTPTHAVLYGSFPSLRGIVHTHSRHATAWAQALKDIPLLGTTHADHLHVPVPCTPVLPAERIRGDYERETGLWIVEHFRSRGLSPDEVPMVLVGGHGPFTWGPTGDKAVYHAAVLEEIAAMAALTLGINPSAAPLPEPLVRRHYERKHGPNATYGQR